MNFEKSGTDPVPIKGKETILTHGSEDFEGSKQDVKKEPTAPIGVDSSGVETDRYEKQERPNHLLQDFEPTRVKTYLKYHITAITAHQITLASYTTPSNASDTSMLPYMVNFLVKKTIHRLKSAYSTETRDTFGSKLRDNIQCKHETEHKAAQSHRWRRSYKSWQTTKQKKGSGDL